MATRTVIVDDLDGTTENVTSHRVGLDGAAYDLDLSPENLANLEAALAPYLTAGRRARGDLSTRRSTAHGSRVQHGPGAGPVRTWWASHSNHTHNGASLPPFRPKGAIPAAVHEAYTAQEAYTAAHTPIPAPAGTEAETETETD